MCKRHACVGIGSIFWWSEHRTAAEPVMEWHPGGGIRCRELAQR
ncbi:hypothetical protein OG429_38560 [Streptomyces sp. NBC_00190]|nr:hypothetical protein [Streptomyces sp. NBC_00190]WSZ44649.1 hypothetical protein OG239_41000 [Streptomyces sp. NBC_00868]